MFKGRWMRVVGVVVMLAAGGMVGAQELGTEATMVRAGSATFASYGGYGTADQSREALIDDEAGYAYFATQSSVVKIALGDRTGPPRFVGNTEIGNQLGAGVIDPQNGYAYFATISGESRIYKVALGEGDAPTTLTAVLNLVPQGGSVSPQGTAVIDPAAGYAYFGFRSHVVKVALGEGSEPPSRVGSVALSDTITPIYSAVIDHVNGYGYFLINVNSVASIAKVDLGKDSASPTVVATLPLEASPSYIRGYPAAVIDVERGEAYFAVERQESMRSAVSLVKVAVGKGSIAPVLLSIDFIDYNQGNPFHHNVKSAMFDSLRREVYLSVADHLLRIGTSEAAGGSYLMERLRLDPVIAAAVMSPSRQGVYAGIEGSYPEVHVHKIGMHADDDEALWLPSTWHFAEGATHPTFQTYYLLANPHDEPLKIDAEYLPENGLPIQQTVMVPGNSRHTILANNIIPDQGLAASFRDPSGKGFAAERAMYSMGPNHRWYGAHAAVGVSEPRWNWYFAEGSDGPAGPNGEPFQTFILVSNPGDFPTTAYLQFFSAGGPSPTYPIKIPAKHRVTIEPREFVDGLAGHWFSTKVSGDRRIIAERAMWWRATSWPAGSPFMEGSASPGLPKRESNWYLAEGNTGGFDDFILLSNPNNSTATVSIRYFLEAGSPIDRMMTIDPGERGTINVRWDPEGIGQAARYGAMITSTYPIAVERSMYFDGGGFGWVGGHNSLASPGLSRKWMLPEGATVPGPVGNIRTEIQILNPQNVPANVEVRFLLDQGATHSEHITIPAERRHTILANDIPELAAKAFSTVVLSSEPIVVDRTMYFDGDTPGLISPIGSTASAGIPASAISRLPKGYTASAAAIQSATSGDAWTLYSPTPTATVTPTPVLLE